MIEKIIFRPAAKADLWEAYNWYEARGDRLGTGFIESVDELVRRICLHPEIYPATHKQVRQGLLKRFPYSVLYLALPEAIIVVAIFHTSRDPRIWQRRVKE